MTTKEYPMLQMELGTLVTRLDLLNRTNLTKLAADLNADFLAAQGKQQNPSDIVFYFNRAALLFFRAAGYEEAMEISWRAIQFCMLCAKNDKHALGKALQPYVNIGRVKAVRGQTEQAIKIFREIYLFMEAGVPFSFGPYKFTAGEWETILSADQPLLTISRNMFLLESLRALLLALDFPRVLSFVEELAQVAAYQEPISQCTILEAQAIAYMELEDLEHATQKMDQLLQLVKNNSFQFPGLYFLLARLLAAKGLHDEAVRAIDSGKRRLQRIADRAGAKLSRDITQTRYLLALAEYLYGVPEQALQILEAVLEEANRLEDEVLELKARLLLTKITLEGTSPALTNSQKKNMIFALQCAAEKTDYQFQRQMIQEYLTKEFAGSGYLPAEQQLEFATTRAGTQSFAPKCQAQLNELRNNLFAYIDSFIPADTERPLKAVSQ